MIMSYFRISLAVLALFVTTGTPAAFAETESVLAQPSAFLQDVYTEEDFAALTDEQKAEVEAFFAAGRPSLSDRARDPLSNTVNCFDYYTFGSVHADLYATVGKTVSGIPLTFEGSITNNNPYPVVDGAVYVKIFKQPADKSFPLNGYDVVDQFFVKEGITLPANGNLPISFVWNVPATLQSGNYQAAFFFTSAHKFNLLGLPFTDDIVGNVSDFSVLGQLTTGVALKKDTVTVDGDDYYFVSFTPKVDKDKLIEVSVEVENTTDVNQTVPITWKTYAWDQQSEDNKIDEVSKTVTVPANSTIRTTTTITDTSSSVYLVVAQTQYQDTKSILNIRFTRDGVPTTRINFPAVTNYPISAGQENTVFSCLHGAGTLDLVDNGKLTLTLTDHNNNKIHTYTYEGGVTGAMMGVKDTFTPTETYKTFTLTAQLYRDNVLVDSATMYYDCNKLSDNCPVVAVPDTTGNAGNRLQIEVLLIALFLLILVGIILVVIRRKKDKQEGESDTEEPTDSTTDEFTSESGKTTPLTLLLITVLSGAVFMCTEQIAEAKSKPVYVQYNGTLLYEPTTFEWSTMPANNGLADPSISFSYSANVYDDVTDALIPPGATIPVGTRLRFEPTRSQVTWDGTGYTNDTPAGTWIDNATFPDGPDVTMLSPALLFFLTGEPMTVQVGQCSSRYRVGPIISGGNSYDVYIPLAVHPGNITLDLSDSSASLTPEGGDVYTVDSAGAIYAVFTFEQTFARFYYEYISPESGLCHTSWALESMGSPDGSLYPKSNPVSIPIPPKTIEIDLTAAAASNTPPNPPMILGAESNSNVANDSQGFTAQATDPDGDNIRYGIDWDMDYIVEQWVPASGYVPSNTKLPFTRTWADSGFHMFQVLTEDDQAAVSNWYDVPVFLCDVGEMWNGIFCVPFVPSCTGVTPPNASLYPGDAADLSTSTPKTYAVNNTATKCEYSCDPSYTWNSGTLACDPPANQPPTATILTPDTGPGIATIIKNGESITFRGTSTDPEGSPITDYEWRDGSCSAGTLLSNSSSFPDNTLSDGTHTIYLRASDGVNWSVNCPSVDVTVVSSDDAPNCGPAVSEIHSYGPTEGLCINSVNTMGVSSYLNTSDYNYYYYWQCENGTDFVGCSALRLYPTNGRLELPSCTIANPGNSSCVADLTWTNIQNITEGSIVETGTTRVSIKEGIDSDSQQSVTLTRSPKLFELFPGPNGAGDAIDGVQAEAICPSPWSWNASNRCVDGTADDPGAPVACGGSIPPNAKALGSDGMTISGQSWEYHPDDTTDCDFVCTSPYVWDGTDSCDIAKPDLRTDAADDMIVPEGDLDPGTNTYPKVVLKNYEVWNTGVSEEDDFRVKFDITVNGVPVAPVYEQIDHLNKDESSGDKSTVLATGVEPGPVIVTMTLDADGVVDEGPGEDNNSIPLSTTLNYPTPTLDLSVEPSPLIRYNSYMNLHWDINGATYLQSCSLSGPKVDSSDTVWNNGDSNTTAVKNNIGPITSKSTYYLTCTAPDDTIYSSAPATVEVTGTIQEL